MCFEGTFLEADTHLRGLKRLVDLRGGYETFINRPLVTRSVTWYQCHTHIPPHIAPMVSMKRAITSLTFGARADLQTSAALGRQSVFPLVYYEEQASLPPDLTAAADSPSLAQIEAIYPGGHNVKQCLVLLRRAILVSGTSASSEIVRLHMHKADDASSISCLMKTKRARCLD